MVISIEYMLSNKTYMSHTAIWKQFGAAISSQHPRTLAAFVGHRDSELALQTDSIPFPTPNHFRADSVFDPNPHQLELPEDLLETSLLVHSLAVWGPDVLIRSAFACAALQMKHHTACRADLVDPRDSTFDVVKRWIQYPTNENYDSVKQASERCSKLYKPYEDDPDSSEANVVWFHLGAPWFAAETAAQDHKLDVCDGPGPREASPTWCTRNAVWPTRAADAAAEWSSHEDVRKMIRKALLDWIANAEQAG
jgi:hypothetical protein